MTAQRQRSSIFTGLLLILLGILLLIHYLAPGLGVGHIVARYWPILLIIWGAAKLIDYQAADRTGQGRPAILSPGEAALLVLVVLVLFGMSVLDYLHRHNSDMDVNLFSEKATDSEEVPAMPLPPGAHVTISIPHGKITAHAGEGNEIRVGVNETATDSSESAAHQRLSKYQILVEKQGSDYVVHPSGEDSSVSADLDIELPKNVSVSATSKHGDFSISGISGSVTAALKEGDVEVHNVSSDVTLDVKHGDIRVSDISGKVHITGKGSEIEVSDITSDLTIDGEFYGPIEIRNIKGTTHFTSEKADISLVSLNGELKLDSGDLDFSDVSGPVKIVCRQKDIKAENVQGRLDIQDTKGDIEIVYTNPPRNDINISNDTGDVQLTLPPNSAFTITATSRSGEARNEFDDSGVHSSEDGGTARLTGSVGSGHAHITISTSYGTLSLHKAD